MSVLLGIYTRIKPILGPLVGSLLGNRYRLPARLLELRLASFLGNKTSERIIEYPWVLKHLAEHKDDLILDVGCGHNGLLASHLLSKGYDIYGLDIVRCTTLPSKRFFHRNARQTELPDSNFDSIILISTLEHIGSDDQEDDRRTMREVHRILKMGGKVFFTTPFAAEYSNRGQRFFSEERLTKVTEGFRKLEENYFLQRGSKWVRVTLEEAKLRTEGYSGVHSIAITTMVLQKN